MRLTPKAGVIWSEKNRLVVAVDLLQDFGDKEHKFLSKVDPQIYYQFNSKTAQAVAGIFPRSLLLARYDPFFLGSAYSFYNNRIQAWPPTINPKRLLHRVRHRLGGNALVPDAREVPHPLGRRIQGTPLVRRLCHDPAPLRQNRQYGVGRRVVDHILLNPYVGYRYEGAYTFDARLGYLQSLQRDRRTEEAGKRPKAGASPCR